MGLDPVRSSLSFPPGIVFVIALYVAFVAWAAARISGTRRESAMNVVLAALPMGSMLKRIMSGRPQE